MTTHPQNTPEFDTSTLTHSRTSRQSVIETAWTVVAGSFLVISLLPLGAVLIYVVVRGSSRLSLAALTELPPPPLVGEGGFGNAIVGTLVIVGIATAMVLPFGVLAAIYLSEFGTGRIPRWIRFATNVLSGVPSIIMGVVVYGSFVLATGTFSAVAGGIALFLLMLPVIIRTTEEALKLVPEAVRWASVGMGASKYQTVFRVVLPAALPAIATGTSLAIARAAGETAPLIFTASFAQYWARGLFEPTASLSVLIYRFAITPYENQQRLAWAASLILVGLVLLTSILSRWATRKSVY